MCMGGDLNDRVLCQLLPQHTLLQFGKLSMDTVWSMHISIFNMQGADTILI